MLSDDIQERLEKKIEDRLVQNDREKKIEKDIFNKAKVISEGTRNMVALWARKDLII